MRIQSAHNQLYGTCFRPQNLSHCALRVKDAARIILLERERSGTANGARQASKLFQSAPVKSMVRDSIEASSGL